MTHKISDDSGFIGLIDANKYESFVDNNWNLDQLFDHFKKQIMNNTLLLWGTGSENIWKIEVNEGITNTKGYRNIIGSIKVSNNALYLINYESLTMAAQFSEVALPEKHMLDLKIPISNGNYNIQIIQYSAPDMDSSSNTDFIIEYDKTEILSNTWKKVAWCDIESN